MNPCPHCEGNLDGSPAMTGPWNLVFCATCGGLVIDEGRDGVPVVRAAVPEDLDILTEESAREVVSLALENRRRIKEKAGHVDPVRFLVNLYRCPACEQAVVTVDVAPGVTPFGVSCARFWPDDEEPCRGVATSSLYKTQLLDEEAILAPEWEWYRPGRDEIIEPRYADHVAQGGLLLRRRTAAPPWPRVPKGDLN